MMFGFSTGSIALNDVRRGLRIATHPLTKAIELSALREEELDPLLQSLDELVDGLRPFEYISFHAPSKRNRLSESELVDRLQQVADRGWPIIIHPDLIEDFSLWKMLGRAVCIENMDKRKIGGRTAYELYKIFDRLPEATFCFDIGHARQVDPTMMEAMEMLTLFRRKLKQVHMSYVNSQSRHERLNFECLRAFRRVSRWIDEAVPIILETPINADEIEREIAAARGVFTLWDADACDVSRTSKDFS